MLKSLKVSYLACRDVCHRPVLVYNIPNIQKYTNRYSWLHFGNSKPMELNLEGLELPKWNQLYLLVYSVFAFQDLQNTIPWGPYCVLCPGLKNIHSHTKVDTFKPVNADNLFLHKICWLLVYLMFCSQFDTNLALIAWTNIHPSIFAESESNFLSDLCIDENFPLHADNWYIPTYVCTHICIYIHIHIYTYIYALDICMQNNMLYVHINIWWALSDSCALHLIKWNILSLTRQRGLS